MITNAFASQPHSTQYACTNTLAQGLHLWPYAVALLAHGAFTARREALMLAVQAVRALVGLGVLLLGVKPPPSSAKAFTWVVCWACDASLHGAVNTL